MPSRAQADESEQIEELSITNDRSAPSFWLPVNAGLLNLVL
jgi:hypothetical protein